jgi:predicted O-methyltransferase YrrM
MKHTDSNDFPVRNKKLAIKVFLFLLTLGSAWFFIEGDQSLTDVAVLLVLVGLFMASVSRWVRTKLTNGIIYALRSAEIAGSKDTEGGSQDCMARTTMFSIQSPQHKTRSRHSRVQYIISLMEQIRSESFRIGELQLLSSLAENDGQPIGEENLSDYARLRLTTMKWNVDFAREYNQSIIRTLFAEEIFPDIDQVCLPLAAMNPFTGHPNKAEMLYVVAIAKIRDAKNIFEFGTYMGRTTYHLASISDDVRVTTLNLPPDRSGKYAPFIGRFFQGTEREMQITQLFEDAYNFDPKPLAKKFDFIFIDGDHSYEGVENDTLKAFKLLKPGGVIMWHDYAPKSPGLAVFIRQFTQNVRPLFRIKNTSLLLSIDGMDPMSFEAHPLIENIEVEAENRKEHKLSLSTIFPV